MSRRVKIFGCLVGFVIVGCIGIIGLTNAINAVDLAPTRTPTLTPTITATPTTTTAPTTTPSPAPTDTPVPSETPIVPVSRCIPASVEQMANITQGIESVEPANSVGEGWAVKSDDFGNVYFVAALIYGPGIPEEGTGPGVWAFIGDPSVPGITLSVDGFAKQFSDWPDGSETDFEIDMSDDGAQESANCAE